MAYTITLHKHRASTEAYPNGDRANEFAAAVEARIRALDPVASDASTFSAWFHATLNNPRLKGETVNDNTFRISWKQRDGKDLVLMTIQLS